MGAPPVTTFRFKTRPMKHQRKALLRGLRRGYLGLLWEPGTGKTKAIIDWAAAEHLKNGLTRVLIVCPMSVIGQWEDQLKLHCPIPYRVGVIDKKIKRIRRPKKKLKFVVVNYDLAWRRREMIHAWYPQMVVSDESHRIKKPSARRSVFMRSLNDVERRAILTGTPTPKNLRDLYGQWVFLNSETFGTQASEFDHRYIVYGGFMKKQVKGYTNLKDLKRKVRKDAMVLRKDQCLDLPEQTFPRVPVILEDFTRKLYDKLAREFFLELKRGEVVDAKNAAVKIMKLQQITGGFVKTDKGWRQVSDAKMTSLREHLEDLFALERRVVVFARFLPEVEAIRQAGIAQGVTTYVLRGGVRRGERDSARRLFQGLPGPSLFVAQIQTGGLGIDLFKARDAIFYSVSHAYDEYKQACDRLHRKGQRHKVTYRHLVGVGTVDLDIYAALQRKEDITKIIMGHPSKLTRRLRIT